jgi:hypothetical protein
MTAWKGTCVPRKVVWIKISCRELLRRPTFWDIRSSRAISGVLLHGRRYTAAIVASLLVNVHTARARPVSINALRVTLLCHGDAV